jgi:hypothetical protein
MEQGRGGVEIHAIELLAVSGADSEVRYSSFPLMLVAPFSSFHVIIPLYILSGYACLKLTHKNGVGLFVTVLKCCW